MPFSRAAVAASSHARPTMVQVRRAIRKPATIRIAAVAQISNDPVDPLPALLSGGWLEHVDVEVARTFAAATFPAGGPPVLAFSEIRHVGGATSRDHGPSAFANRDKELLWHALGVPMDEASGAAVAEALGALETALGDALSDRRYLNFLDGEARRRSLAARNPSSASRSTTISVTPWSVADRAGYPRSVATASMALL